jgi:pimeloyl-ACP methyl ester carboxylesterase
VIFEGCQSDLHGDDWSQALAWRFAQMSVQAYRSCLMLPKEIAAYWRADGCERITHGSQSMLVLWDQQDVVMAFEGSNPTAEDWIANADRSTGQMGQYRVHNGFLREYLKLARPLTELVEDNHLRDRRIHVTGHSQGGAIANIAACQRTVRQCYTFGTPKTFKDRRPHPAISGAWYHWHSNDGVPHLPVFRGFQHLSRLCYVRQKKGAIVEPSFWHLAWLKFTSYSLGDTFSDHAAQSYAEALVI